MEFKDKEILILSIFVVLVSSWLVGNLMHMRIDLEAEPIFLGLPEGVFVGGIIIFISIPVVYFSFLYYRSEGDKTPMLSGLLQLGFWVFASISTVLFIVLGVWPMIRHVDFSPSIEFVLPRVPFLLDIGFILLLVPCVFLLVSYIYLRVAKKEERKETNLEVMRRDDLLESHLEEEKQTIESSFTSTLDRAIMDLDRGGDVYSTIIRVYREMSKILEEKGAVNDKSMTPREFKNKTIETIPASKKMVSEITFLFEEARYSPHDLDRRDRDKVLKQIKELKEGLS